MNEQTERCECGNGGTLESGLCWICRFARRISTLEERLVTVEANLSTVRLKVNSLTVGPDGAVYAI
jgi:hypothetical protein